LPLHLLFFAKGLNTCLEDQVVVVRGVKTFFSRLNTHSEEEVTVKGGLEVFSGMVDGMI